MSNCYFWWKAPVEMLPLFEMINAQLMDSNGFYPAHDMSICFTIKQQMQSNNLYHTINRDGNNGGKFQLTDAQKTNLIRITANYKHTEAKSIAMRDIVLQLGDNDGNEQKMLVCHKISRFMIGLSNCRIHWPQRPEYDGMQAATEFYHMCRELLFVLRADRAMCRVFPEWEGEGIEDEDKMIACPDAVFMFQPKGRQLVSQRLEDGVEILENFEERRGPVEIYIGENEVEWFRKGGLRSPPLTPAQLEENQKLLRDYFHR